VSEQPEDQFYWVGAIQTATGKAFDIVTPSADMIDLTDLAVSIGHICRYNGHVPSFYSVAEHSVRVSRWLAHRGWPPEMQLTGLLHDAAEAYVGDMVRPMKRHPEFGPLHQQIEDRVAEVLHGVLGGIYPHPQPVHDADRAIYDWEVANIRTGIETGWDPDFSRRMFLAEYEHLKRKLND
jgi:hypothetical protein